MLLHYAKSVAQHCSTIIPVNYLGVATFIGEPHSSSSNTTNNHNFHIDTDDIIKKCLSEVRRISADQALKNDAEAATRKAELLELVQSYRIPQEDKELLNALHSQVQSIKTEVAQLAETKNRTQFDEAQWVQCSYCNAYRLLKGEDVSLMQNLASKLGDYEISCLALGADCATACDHDELNRKKPRAMLWAELANSLQISREKMFSIINDEDFHSS